jgi:hypothetical protein
MNRVTLLVLFLLFAPCGTSHADVITLEDGSVFEGKLDEKKEAMTWFKVVDGTVGLGDEKVVSVEDRKPTTDEKARLIRFKTERYDVTEESADSMTLYEEEVLEESRRNSDTFDDAHVRIVAEKLDLPPIIVEMIFIKAWWPW